MADILIVDDDDHMRILIKMVLTRRGHRVSEASDGTEALTRFDAKSADVVVTDLVMPGTGGVALLHALRQKATPPKVLMVSGKEYPGDEDLTRLAAEGCIAFLGKPFTPNQLAERVRTALDTAAGPA